MRLNPSRNNDSKGGNPKISRISGMDIVIFLQYGEELFEVNFKGTWSTDVMWRGYFRQHSVFDE